MKQLTLHLTERFLGITISTTFSLIIDYQIKEIKRFQYYCVILSNENYHTKNKTTLIFSK